MLDVQVGVGLDYGLICLVVYGCFSVYVIDYWFDDIVNLYFDKVKVLLDEVGYDGMLVLLMYVIDNVMLVLMGLVIVQ